MTPPGLAAEIVGRAAGRDRFVLAIAGAPGAGKSTMVERLLGEIEAQVPGAAVVMPMDGYHFDNAVLCERGLQGRKGAPQTFDVDGLHADLLRVRTGHHDVAIPVFDRALDLARAGGRIVRSGHSIVLVEGNYLLLDLPPWTELAECFDTTLFIDVPEAELRRRLIARWLLHGLNPEAALARAEDNDLPNARLVVQRSRPAQLRWAMDNLAC